jgi:non-ribosomal peptide synthetase-like protein
LAWDDIFADHGGHSIVIARLSQRLWAAGRAVPVRALLTDCDTPRKVAARPQDPGKPTEIPAAAAKSDRGHSQHDAKAARVLSVACFTTLQILFLAVLYSPLLVGFLGLVAFGEIGEFFMTAHLWQFVVVGFFMYLFALVLPFANLLWVLVIKLFMGRHMYKNRVTPGVYPKWSRMHLKVWCIERLETSVLRPMRTMFRSAPLMAYVLRRLGASVGHNLHCAYDVEFAGPLDLLTTGDDVTIQSGAYICMSNWVGPELHIGPVCLGRGCKIGMRALVANDVTVGRGSWITPLTPILSDVGEEEMWEGAPARFNGFYTELKRTAERCRYAYPFWFLETLNILMQVFLDFWLLVVPTAAVTWFAATFIPGSETELASQYFRVTPLHQIVWHIGLYAFVTTWVTSVLISVLGCLFIRGTPASPGLYPSRGLKGALLMYRVKKMNEIQRLWTWTITGQYLRALAGLRFSRLGASECDVMLNLVPELAIADSHVFWSHGCFTNMLDQGAEHLKLRQLEMPANFFGSNNCVAESGHFPTNFLLGVSTPGNDIEFRLQTRSRPGEPITVAGNPPVRFASADFEGENEARRLPGFPLFLARVLLNDVLGVGILRIANVLAYVVVYTILLRLGVDVLFSAFLSLIFAEVALVVSCAAVKKLLVGSRWGTAHSAPFWSWRHFSYFFAQDCFFAWCRAPLRILGGTLLPNTILRWMGCRIGKRTLVTAPLQAFDWNAVNFGDDCIIGGLLQFHTFENLMLKVKKTDIHDGTVVNVGATVMGGAVIEPETTLLPLSMVLKEMHLPTGTYWGSPTEPVSEGEAPITRPGVADEARQ